jgi:hypothetical protein
LEDTVDNWRDEYRDSKYIPRMPNAWPGLGKAAEQWFRDDLEAKRRLQHTQEMLEPLKPWVEKLTEADLAFLESNRIKPF